MKHDGPKGSANMTLERFLAEVVEPVRPGLVWLFWKCIPGVLLVAVFYAVYRLINPKPRREY